MPQHHPHQRDRVDPAGASSARRRSKLRDARAAEQAAAAEAAAEARAEQARDDEWEQHALERLLDERGAAYDAEVAELNRDPHRQAAAAGDGPPCPCGGKVCSTGDRVLCDGSTLLDIRREFPNIATPKLEPRPPRPARPPPKPARPPPKPAWRY